MIIVLIEICKIFVIVKVESKIYFFFSLYNILLLFNFNILRESFFVKGECFCVVILYFFRLNGFFIFIKL